MPRDDFGGVSIDEPERDEFGGLIVTQAEPQEPAGAELAIPESISASFTYAPPPTDQWQINPSSYETETGRALPQFEPQNVGLLGLAAPLAAGIETGLNTGEKMIRSGLDLVGYYPLLDVLAGGGTKYQDYNKAWMDYFANREAQLQRENIALGQTGFVPELLQGTAQAAVELPLQLMGGAGAATPKAAVTGASLMAGAIGGLSQYGQERQEGAGRLEAAAKGATSGAITALTTKAFGATGVESIFAKEGVAGVKNRILEILKQMGFEGAEEATDQFQQDLLERVTKNPEKPISQSVHDVLMAGSIGTALGGGVSTVAQVAQGMRPEPAAEPSAVPVPTEVPPTVPPTTPPEVQAAGKKAAVEPAAPIKSTKGIHFVRNEADLKQILSQGLKPGPGMGQMVSFYHEGQRPSDFGVGRTKAVIFEFEEGAGGSPKYEGSIPFFKVKNIREATPEEIQNWGKPKPTPSAKVEAPKPAPVVPEFTPEQAESKGYTIRAYRGISKSKPFNESGTVWLTTNKDVAEVYAKETFGYDDAAVIEVFVNPKDIPTYDIRKLSQDELSKLEPDASGNPQKIGIYEHSDDSLLGSGYPQTAIHVPMDRIAIAKGMKVEAPPAEPVVPETMWSSASPEPGKPIYLSNRKADADAYGVGRPSNQYKVAPKKPFDTNNPQDAELAAMFERLGGIHEAPQNPEFVNALKAKGYDSIIGGEAGYGGESKWVVLLDGDKAKPIAKAEPMAESELQISGKVEGMSPDEIAQAVLSAVFEGGMFEGLKEGPSKSGHYVVAPPDKTIPGDEPLAIGPFKSKKAAQDFLDAEVGAPGAKVVKVYETPTIEPTPPTTGPGLVEMGAATPAEFVPPVAFTTSNKNAKVDEERKARGLPPMMALERQSNQEAWDSAMRQIDENPQVQDELIAELTNQPRALTTTENAMLLQRRIDLRNEYEKALMRWREAFESDDMVRAADESMRVRDWSSKLSDLEDITKATGAESGRSLQARKMMANEDFSLAAMELRAMEAKGRALTPDEHIQLIKTQQRIVELENRIAELEANRDAVETDKAVNETLKGISVEAPKEAKAKDFDPNQEAKVLAGIKAKAEKGQINDITSLVQKLAKVFWIRGIREREAMIDALHTAIKGIVPEFTREDTQRAFSGYGNFKPLSKEDVDVGLRDLRGQTQQVLKLEALEARKPLEKTGVERRVPSDEERRLIKQVNELKRRYGVVVTDPETQLKSALAARKTYYEHRIADLQYEIDTRQRIVKTKTVSPTDPELDALIAEVERLKAEHAQIFTKPGMTDEQRLKVAIAAAERNLAHWQVRLDNAEQGIFDKRVPGRKVTSPELELIQAEAAAIREHVKELHDLAKPKKSKEQIALQSLKTRMANQTANLKRRILNKDFAKKVREPVKLDAEGLRLMAELDLAKEDFKTKLEQDRWSRMSVWNKTRRKVVDVYDAARALMTTGELSFILRQGKLAVLAHPLRTAKALPDMFRALLANEQLAYTIDLQTHNDPDADAARAAKLHLVREGVSLHKQEEILMGRWVGKIPIVKNFNRAAQVFLNRIRLDMWKAMRKSLTKSGTPTPEEDRQIAMFVNEATGRGGLWKLETAAVPLARVMFSPRYYASRLQLVAGHSLWGGTMRTRRIIATEYARALIGLGLYYTALSMMFRDEEDKKQGEIGIDWRSTDFGKVKIGNTRLDPLAGLSQIAVLAGRTYTGEKVTTTGKEVAIRGKKVKFGGDKWTDIVANHLRGKLHPVPGAVANLFDGTDLGGDEATIINQTQNLVAPITYMDIYAALKEQDLDDGAALALLALLGEGLQTYKKKPVKFK